MAIFKADRNQVGFFYESGTYANTSGTIQWLGQVQDATPDPSINRLINRFQGTDSRNVSQFNRGPEDYTASVTYHIQDWKMLAFALGSNVDGGAPSPYTHTISESDNGEGNAFTSGTRAPFVSFSLEIAQKTSTANQNFIRTLNGCNIGTFTLTANPGEKINCTIDVVAESEVFSSGAASSLTENTDRPFLWDDTSVFIEGTQVENVALSEFVVANNPDARHLNNGSKEIASPTMGNRDYTFTVTTEGNTLQSASYYDQYFRGGSTFNAQLKIDASTGSRDCIITMSGCSMIDHDAPNPLEGTDEHVMTIQPQTVDVLVNDPIEKYNPW